MAAVEIITSSHRVLIRPGDTFEFEGATWAVVRFANAARDDAIPHVVCRPHTKCAEPMASYLDNEGNLTMRADAVAQCIAVKLR